MTPEMTPLHLLEVLLSLFVMGCGGMWLQRVLTKPVMPVNIGIPKEIMEQLIATGQPINIVFQQGPPPTPS